MRAVRLGLLAALLLALAGPELARYGAERDLYRAVGLAQALAAGRVPAARGLVVDRIDALARSAGRALPGDPRPPMARGTGHLALRHAPEARAAFRDALDAGERSDALLGLGLAEAEAGDPDRARAAFLRAIWISPTLLPRLPEPQRSAARLDLARRERLFAAGEPGAVPPAPGR